MLGLCPSLPLPRPTNNRPQFQSVIPLPSDNFHHRSRSSTMPNATFAFAATSTRPHAFTTGGTGLDGLQRDWMGQNNSEKRQQQIQQLFRPKQLPLASSRRISPFSSSFPSANANSIRAHSPPLAGAQNLAQQLCCLSSSMQNCGNQAEQSLRQFLRLYDDRQFPIRFIANSSQRADRRKFEWLVNLDELRATERRELIRRFAVGLPIEKQPYSLIALHALKDLFSTSSLDLADSLHILVPQLRLALNSGQTWKKLEALELLREIAQIEGIGPKLVPHFRILLPPLRIGRLVRRASTDYSACQRDQLVNAIDRTLLILEQKGGPKASIHIKHLIPDYQPMYIGANYGAFNTR